MEQEWNETRAGAKMFKGVIQDLLPCMKEAGEIVRSHLEHKDPIYKVVLISYQN